MAKLGSFGSQPYACTGKQSCRGVPSTTSRNTVPIHVVYAFSAGSLSGIFVFPHSLPLSDRRDPIPGGVSPITTPATTRSDEQSFAIGAYESGTAVILEDLASDLEGAYVDTPVSSHLPTSSTWNDDEIPERHNMSHTNNIQVEVIAGSSSFPLPAPISRTSNDNPHVINKTRTCTHAPFQVTVRDRSE